MLKIQSSSIRRKATVKQWIPVITARFQEQQELGSEGHNVRRVWRISKRRRKTERKGKRRGKRKMLSSSEDQHCKNRPREERQGKRKMAGRTGGDWSSRGSRLLFSSKRRGGNESGNAGK